MRLKPGIAVATYLTMLLACLNWQSVHSGELSKPSGKVLLTITGNIENTNAPASVELDIEMLEQLENTSFVTRTPWTEGPTKFTGVRINHLLEFVGAKSSHFRANAIDKYWNDLTDMDFDKIPAIVAYKINDKYMRVRDLGPLWLIFPFDDFPETDNEKHKTASVWQLIEITVH